MLGSLLTPPLNAELFFSKIQFCWRLRQHNTAADYHFAQKCTPCITFNCLRCGFFFHLNLNVNIQEGLTPSHLKKAKLMFFYTRYPSSNVLKAFFPDVKVKPFFIFILLIWKLSFIQLKKGIRTNNILVLCKFHI